MRVFDFRVVHNVALGRTEGHEGVSGDCGSRFLLGADAHVLLMVRTGFFKATMIRWRIDEFSK